jgi:hypothetical protein
MITISIKRIRDINAVRVVSRNPLALAREQEFVRGLDRLMLVSSHLADEDQRQVGALIALLLRARPDIDNIDLVHTDAGYWFATAIADKDGNPRRYRGEGMTPEEAVITLIAYAQGL